MVICAGLLIGTGGGTRFREGLEGAGRAVECKCSAHAPKIPPGFRNSRGVHGPRGGRVGGLDGGFAGGGFVCDSGGVGNLASETPQRHATISPNKSGEMRRK